MRILKGHSVAHGTGLAHESTLLQQLLQVKNQVIVVLDASVLVTEGMWWPIVLLEVCVRQGRFEICRWIWS